MDEVARAALACYSLMGAEPESMFDDLVRLAARITGVPTSGSGLVGPERMGGEVAPQEAGGSTARLASAFAATPIGMVLTDLRGTILEVNEAMAVMLGRTVAELVGQDGSAHRVGAGTAEEDIILEEMLAGTRDRVVREMAFVHGDGHHVHGLVTAVLIPATDAAPAAWLWQIESIDERRQAEDALLERQSAHDAIMTVDSARRITAWNAGAARTFGWTRSEILGQSVRILVPARLWTIFDAEGDGAGQGVAAAAIDGTIVEMVGQHKDGREMPLEVSWSRWYRDGQRYFTSHSRDVTERAALQAALLAQASTDPVTGVPNRGAFTRQLAALMAETAPVAVIVFQLARFSQLTTGLGPAAGDEILTEVGRRLRDELRPGDLLGHLGADTFAIALPATTVPATLKIAIRLREALHDRPISGAIPVTVDVGAGIAIARRQVSPAHAGTSANRVLRNAALALSDASPGRPSVFRTELVQTAHRRVRVHTALEQAIRRDALDVAYQPQIALSDGRLKGVEALARWTDCDLGSVSPAEFIPLAEDSDLIDQLGAWVLTTACRSAAPWAARLGEFDLSVNLSGRQLADDGIVDTVAKALAASGLPATALILEVTESVLMTDTDKVIARLTALTELGVRISVDDFGTGFSNLASLIWFPIAELKIDRSFVTPLPESTRAVKVVTTLLNLAASLGLTTVAEGIETADQKQLLTDLGCQTGQGYLFSRPVDAGAIDRLMQDSRHRHVPRLALRVPNGPMPHPAPDRRDRSQGTDLLCR